jgi:hypothetical protein
MGVVSLRRVAAHFAHNAVAYAALFVALGGTSYAATNLPARSVGTAQLKDGAVTPSKVAAATILRFRGQTGKRGAAGPHGPKGDTGAKGDTGPKGDPGATNVVVRRSMVFTTGGMGSGNATASCATGERAVGGGAGLTIGSTSQLTVTDGKPTPNGEGQVPTAWNAGVTYTAAGIQWAVYVICASP